MIHHIAIKVFKGKLEKAVDLFGILGFYIDHLPQSSE